MSLGNNIQKTAERTNVDTGQLASTNLGITETKTNRP